jgi:hypothetical protein
LSSSVAHTLVHQSPAHAWAKHPKGGNVRSERTPSTDNGNLIDALLLGGMSNVAELPFENFRTKAAQEARDEAIANHRTPVLAKDMGEARDACVAITWNLRRGGVILDGLNQQTVVWDNLGAKCRGRLDHWKPEIATIYDLKTTRSAHPKAVANHMLTYGYDVQAAAYTQAIESIIPSMAGRVRFVFLFVETVKPFATLIAHPAGTMRELGARKWQRACEMWVKCLARKEFPCYGDGETEIEAPPWALIDESNGAANAMEVPNDYSF